tara:strand:+ start:1488 stop:2288 length:801 start_codon:yes stop_codon:yes gene_type:complete
MWILFILILLFAYLYITANNNLKFVKSRDDTPGFKVLDVFNESEVNYILGLVKSKQYLAIKKFINNHPGILKEIYSICGEEYTFVDYIFSIEKSSVSTCHRDENGFVFNSKLKYPSYTIIFYLEDMKACLDVIPNSHEDKNKIYLSKSLESVPCKPGQAILFNADLIHSGSINEKDDNKRIQMKITHKDDLENVKQFDKYYRVGDVSKDTSKQSTLFFRRLSCGIPGLADLTKNGNGMPKFMEHAYKKFVYGDKDNYKLKVIEPVE